MSDPDAEDCSDYNYDEQGCLYAGCNYGGDGYGSNQCWGAVASGEVPEMPALLVPAFLAVAGGLIHRQRKRAKLKKKDY